MVVLEMFSSLFSLTNSVFCLLSTVFSGLLSHIFCLLCLLSTVLYHLSSVFCLLTSVYYLLTSVLCLMPIAFCLLSTDCCLVYYSHSQATTEPSVTFLWLQLTSCPQCSHCHIFITIKTICHNYPAQHPAQQLGIQVKTTFI